MSESALSLTSAWSLKPSGVSNDSKKIVKNVYDLFEHLDEPTSKPGGVLSRSAIDADKILLLTPKSTASSLLKFAGTWSGDDLEKCLEDVKSVRGKAIF
jgi:hypothetical protein